MSDGFKDSTEEYEAVLGLENIFLERVDDEEIKRAYLEARKGEQAGWKTLTEIAGVGWANPTQATDRHGKADRALGILHMFGQSKTQ